MPSISTLSAKRSDNAIGFSDTIRQTGILRLSPLRVESIYKPVSHHYRFVRSARVIALLTLVSRILGVVREMTYSHFFGASPILSAYRVAFQVPNLARRLFGEGALTSSFIPVFTRHRAEQGDESAQRLAGGVITMATALLTLALILIEIGLLVARVFTWNPTLALTAILMPYMVLICLTALFGGMLNALDRFIAPALSPTILNIILIATAWAGGWFWNLGPPAHLELIAYSVLVAGVLQLALQVGWLRRTGFWPRLNLNWRQAHIGQVITLMTPMVLGMSAVQVNTLADTLIALLMVPDGRGPAILGFSQYLYMLPLGIFGTALATAIFPLLARHAAEKDKSEFIDAVERGLRTTLFISLPAGVGLMLIATPAVRLLFEHGEFTPSDTQRVVRALLCYSTAIWAYSVQHILIRAFYSLQDSRAPYRIAVAMVGLNLILNLTLVGRFQEAGVAAATAVSAIIQVALLTVTLRTRMGTFPWQGVWRTTSRALIATALMSAAVWAIRELWSRMTIPGGDATELAAAMATGAAVYAIAARIARLEELGAFFDIKKVSG